MSGDKVVSVCKAAFFFLLGLSLIASVAKLAGWVDLGWLLVLTPVLIGVGLFVALVAFSLFVLYISGQSVSFKDLWK